MKFKLSEKDFNFIKIKMPDAYKFISDAESKKGVLTFTVQEVLEFQLEMTMAVVDKGMDDEDTVNTTGMRMYDIYDEILYQKHNA